MNNDNNNGVRAGRHHSREMGCGEAKRGERLIKLIGAVEFNSRTRCIYTLIELLTNRL